VLQDRGLSASTDLLSLRGYANVRNLCQLVPYLTGADVAVLIDDDEVFRDARFLGKAREFAGTGDGDDFIGLVAGYYLQPDGSLYVGREQTPWMRAWGQYDALNAAFAQIIERPPRLKETPFAFGGNLLIHRRVTETVPFDPLITRGEDIDFLMNARMFGYRCHLDRDLTITHLPPPKTHPLWRQHREDIIRFSYQREKLRRQQDTAGMTRVSTAELMPYPGRFLGENLESLAADSAALLAAEYEAQGDTRAAAEARHNPDFIWSDAGTDPFQHLVRLQERWRNLVAALHDLPPETWHTASTT
jgi:hypothetical protein